MLLSSISNQAISVPAKIESNGDYLASGTGTAGILDGLIFQFGICWVISDTKKRCFLNSVGVFWLWY
jgi:hypothetical protein